MEARPISQHPQPAYPSRREFLAAAAALGATGICGCGTDAKTSALVAPIFAHGEGRGATGCIVMSPPVFLSEEEALQVVREELAKSGVTLGDEMPLPEVTVEYKDPDHGLFLSNDAWLGEPPATIAKQACLTAVDREHRVGVRVVTQGECDRFRSNKLSSVSLYNAKDLAECIAKAIQSQAKLDLAVGVFYDPMESRGRNYSDESATEDIGKRVARMVATAREKSQANLRRQVQDFVRWLEGQKANR